MKNIIRKEFLYKRNNMTKNEIFEKSNLIQEKFLDSHYYKKCKSIFTYINIGSEVITTQIIKKALSENKKVAVPKILNTTKNMIFVEINSLDNLKRSNFNILEPIEFTETLADFNTVFLIPAIVFDINNYRVGYGGGYYDKYLIDTKYLIKIGLAYDFQIINSIPKDNYDVNVDYVITN